MRTCNIHHISALQLDIRGEWHSRGVVAAQACQLQLATIEPAVFGSPAGSIGITDDVQGAVEVISGIITRQQPLAEQYDVGHTCSTEIRGGGGGGEFIPRDIFTAGQLFNLLETQGQCKPASIHVWESVIASNICTRHPARS